MLLNLMISDHMSNIIMSLSYEPPSHSNSNKSLLPRFTYKPTMHAFAIFNALALGATLAHAAAIPAISGATAHLQRRNDCY